MIAIASTKPYTLYVNGTKVLAGADWNQPDKADIRSLLKHGTNALAVEIKSAGAAKKPGEMAPGVIVYARIRRSGDETEEILDVPVDASWVWSSWQTAEFAEAGWKHAVELGKRELRAVEAWRYVRVAARTW